MELRILQPTMSSTKMVDGAFLTEKELEQPGIPALQKAVTDAIETVEALRAQRNLLNESRQLKRQQEEDLRLSEMEDKRKKARETGEESDDVDDDEQAGDEDALDNTIVDSEEVRDRRLQRFGQVAKGGAENQDDSGTVTISN